MKYPPPPRRLAVVIVWLAVTAVAGLAAQAAVAPHGYPRLAFYGSIRGNGVPFFNSPSDTTLDPTVLDEVSRYEEIILDVNPIYPYRPDVLRELRKRNPNARMLAYVVGQNIWNAYDNDSLNHYPTRYRRIVDDNNGWLYDRVGAKYYAGNVNLAKQDSTGRFVIADSLALLWKNVAIDSGIWDGIFYDILCDEMGWPQAGGDSIDFKRAGYNSFPEFNQHWTAATDTIAELMRNWGGPNFIMVGNCALGTKYTTFNGWMREGFPYQAGGDWYSNMYWAPGGYFTDDANFIAPRHDYIFSFQTGEDPYGSNNCRAMRFGLGSATLADGFGVFGGSDRDATHADYQNWWYDEYAVDLATGRASSLAKDTGWLGQAMSNYYQMIWISDMPDAIANPDFETNLTNWQFYGGNPSTFSRDTTTAGSGRACARVDIPHSNAIDWYTNIYAPLTYDLNPYTTYSATFRIKATTARTLTVAIGVSGQPLQYWRTIAAGTDWAQIQIPFYTFDRQGPSGLSFYLAKDAGTVWIDDVHFQQGVSTVYRRDFENGTVLVNPSTDNEADVKMERTFRRILGTSDPITNDGSVSNLQYVPPNDALFLLGDDHWPPAQVKDLHQVLGPH